MNADGSGQHWIGQLGFAPRWSPDGSLFFVTSGHDQDRGFNPFWMEAEDLLSVITPASTRNLGSVKALFR